MKKKTEKWEVFIKNGRTKIISILTINFGHLYYQAAIDRAISLVNIELLKMSEQRESVEKPFESFDSILQQFSYPPPSRNQR